MGGLIRRNGPLERTLEPAVTKANVKQNVQCENQNKGQRTVGEESEGQEIRNLSRERAVVYRESRRARNHGWARWRCLAAKRKE